MPFWQPCGHAPKSYYARRLQGENMFQEESHRSSNKNILIAAIVLVLIAGGGFFWFFHTQNHPDVTVTIQQTEIVPIHLQYAHVFGHVGPDQTDDATYVLARVAISNLSDATFFVKDMTANLQPADGEAIASPAMQKEEISRLLTGYPQLEPAMEKLRTRPLLRETTIAPHSAVSGFIILQFASAPTLWNERKDATLQVDFYRNVSFSGRFPK